MGHNNWISGVGVMLLTQIGPILTGCGGGAADYTHSTSGGGENLDDTGSTSGGTGGGGTGGGGTGGDGTGGNVDVGGLPHRELCIIESGPCEDGVVHAMVGVSCTTITVTCEAGCSPTPTPVDVTLNGHAFLDDAIARERITEALCAPVDDGIAGAAGAPTNL